MLFDCLTEVCCWHPYYITIESTQISLALFSQVSAVETVDKNFLVWCNSDGGATLWLPSSLHNPSHSLTWNLMLGTQCTRLIPVCENR